MSCLRQRGQLIFLRSNLGEHIHLSLANRRISFYFIKTSVTP
jgi:hypothetical protein